MIFSPLVVDDSSVICSWYNSHFILVVSRETHCFGGLRESSRYRPVSRRPSDMPLCRRDERRLSIVLVSSACYIGDVLFLLCEAHIGFLFSSDKTGWDFRPALSTGADIVR